MLKLCRYTSQYVKGKGNSNYKITWIYQDEFVTKNDLLIRWLRIGQSGTMLKVRVGYEELMSYMILLCEEINGDT